MNEKRIDSRFLPLVLDVVNQGIFTVDRNGRISSFNRAAELITGYNEEEVIGHQCAEIFQTELCVTECPLKQSIQTRDQIRDREVAIKTKQGRSIPCSVSTAPLVTPGGRLIGGVEVLNDLSSIKGLRRRLESQFRFDDIISKSESMNDIFGLLPLASESNSNILITGHSGTGKELVASAIHNHSHRKHKPIVPVNCAALPDTLLESELFGYRKGAFTDAITDKPGRIAQAEGGTLFIDEVGDLPPQLQPKLLRFLQSRIYEPLGATEPVQADVRVISATNRDLEQEVARGTFREDLFYRLNVLQITLPPLKERLEDIPLLVEHFIDRFRLTTGRSINGITTDALAALLHHDYPGNIRELENVIERAFVLCLGDQISTVDLPEHIRPKSAGRPAVGNRSGRLLDAEAQAVRQALIRHRGNRTRAAAELGIHRSTLIRKIKKYGPALRLDKP